MAGRTVIIATHAVESLAPLADRAIYLDDGRVQWQGTGLELLETEYMSHLKSEAAFSQPLDVKADVATAAPDQSSMPRKTSLASQSGPESFEVVRLPAKTPRQLLVDEDRAKGSVAFGLWTDLLKMNGGPVYFVAFVAFTLISIIGPVAERQYLK
jgi:ABC-type multidrug transport system ATPase subunit